MNRGRLTWVLSYVYLAYLFLGNVPGLSDLPVFSVQAAFVLLVLLYLFSSYVNWGVVKASKFLLATWLISYVIEFIGTRTGYPFGNYAYTSAMGPSVGPIPVFIPFLWCALGYFCLQAAGPSVMAPALLMVLLDLSLDPIFARGLWHWENTAGPYYFGVPVLNFFGWFLTSLIIFASFRIMMGAEDVRRQRRRRVFSSAGSPQGIGFYFLFGLNTVLYQISEGLPTAAAVSLSLYAIAALLLLWTTISRRQRGGREEEGEEEPRNADATVAPGSGRVSRQTLPKREPPSRIRISVRWGRPLSLAP